MRLLNESLTKQAISELMYHIHQTATSKGWWEKDRDYPELLMLVVSELSEGLEGVRRSEPRKSDKIPEFSEIEEELADAVIRIMDMCEHKGLRLGEAMIEKMKYNDAREFRHGGKKH
jgi:NTP pyrophosphatase (non-canonical NTP hydrolase)